MVPAREDCAASNAAKAALSIKTEDRRPGIWVSGLLDSSGSGWPGGWLQIGIYVRLCVSLTYMYVWVIFTQIPCHTDQKWVRPQGTCNPWRLSREFVECVINVKELWDTLPKYIRDFPHQKKSKANTDSPVHLKKRVKTFWKCTLQELFLMNIGYVPMLYNKPVRRNLWLCSTLQSVAHHYRSSRQFISSLSPSRYNGTHERDSSLSLLQVITAITALLLLRHQGLHHKQNFEFVHGMLFQELII